MDNPPASPAVAKTEPPWWRIPQVVFVPALLLTGVIATSTMVVISAQDQDPVLDKEVYERELKAAQALQGQARIDALNAVVPAGQGRNHAASPSLPSLEK